jgi:hypothetical protein
MRNESRFIFRPRRLRDRGESRYRSAANINHRLILLYEIAKTFPGGAPGCVFREGLADEIGKEKSLTFITNLIRLGGAAPPMGAERERGWGGLRNNLSRNRDARSSRRILLESIPRPMTVMLCKHSISPASNGAFTRLRSCAIIRAGIQIGDSGVN